MKFIFARDRTVSSTSGRTIEYKKGVPTHTPPGMHNEVIAAGGVPEDELDDGDEQKGKDIPTGADRDAIIKAAMEEMVASNIREEFTAAGAPHTKKLTEKVGFVVNDKERNALWSALKQGA
jgi:hypothetical protein